MEQKEAYWLLPYGQHYSKTPLIMATSNAHPSIAIRLVDTGVDTGIQNFKT